jgi:PII-like signaling protein
MNAPTQGTLLRIFIGSSDHWHGKSLYQALVEEAKNQGLAGATVLQGVMGYGARSRIHTARLIDISPDLPIVVEVVDEDAKIQAFLPTVHEMVTEGLVTLEAARVLLYQHRDSDHAR